MRHNFTTLRHDNIKLQKKVSTGKKVFMIMRDQWTTVTKTNPLENLLTKSEGLMTEKLLPLSE